MRPSVAQASPPAPGAKRDSTRITNPLCVPRLHYSLLRVFALLREPCFSSGNNAPLASRTFAPDTLSTHTFQPVFSEKLARHTTAQSPTCHTHAEVLFCSPFASLRGMSAPLMNHHRREAPKASRSPLLRPRTRERSHHPSHMRKPQKAPAIHPRPDFCRHGPHCGVRGVSWVSHAEAVHQPTAQRQEF